MMITSFKSYLFCKKFTHGASTETLIDKGIFVSVNTSDLATKFIATVAQLHFWDRENVRKFPA